MAHQQPGQVVGQAEALGAQLVTLSGRPSHYVLTETDGLAKLFGKPDDAKDEA